MSLRNQLAERVRLRDRDSALASDVSRSGTSPVPFLWFFFVSCRFFEEARGKYVASNSSIDLNAFAVLAFLFGILKASVVVLCEKMVV